MPTSASGGGPRISVVVVNWNGRAHLETCLESLAVQSDPDFDAIVVDNGSDDDSVAFVRECHPRVEVVALPENAGFAEGFNQGLARATGAWVASLNNDAQADSRWIEVMRRAAARADPSVGMLQSRVVDSEQSSRLRCTGVLLRRGGRFADRDAGRPDEEGPMDGTVFCASAAAALYRRRMLDELRLESGVFDRSFFLYFEDVDFGWRARLAEWSALYVRDAIVRHVEHASSRVQGDDFVSAQCRINRGRTLLKNASLGFIARSLPQLLRDLLWTGMHRGRRGVTAWLAALHDGLRQRPRVTRKARLGRRAVEGAWLER